MSTLPITEAERQASRDFLPPALRRGQPVMWYPSAQPHSLPVPAIAVKDNFQGDGSSSQVINRTSHIVLADGRVVFTCPHLSDPELKWNYQKTKNGAWDYSDYEQYVDEKRLADLHVLNNKIKDLQQRVDALTKSIAAKSSKPAKSE